MGVYGVDGASQLTDERRNFMTTEQLREHWPEWEIDAELGSGSFGTVYRIKRAMFGDKLQYAALKVIHIPKNQVEVRQLQSEGMDDASVSAYFQSFVQNLSDEIDLLSRLKGTSNIVSYEDHKIIAEEGKIGWTILIRMELLVPLNDHLRQNPMNQREVLQLGIDICKALELCGKNRIIHRDIKPDNIFLSPNGDFKLGDFGVARELEKTTIGLSRKGTFNYMAPEVFHGKPYNATVDIYSLGIVLYRLLNNNRTPFLPSAPQPISYNDREQAQQLLLSGTSIPPLQNVPAELNSIVLKMCAHHPDDRYQNAAELQAALEGIGKSSAMSLNENAEALPEDGHTDVVVPIPVEEPTDVFDEPVQAEEPTDILPAIPPYDEPTDALDYPELNPSEPVRRPIAVEYQTSPPKAKNKKALVVLAVVFVVIVTAVTAVYGGRKAAAKSHFEKGNSYSLSEQYDNAIYEYSEAIRLSVNYSEAYLNRALAYYELERYGDAVSDYEASGSSLNSDKFAAAYYGYGMALRKSKDYYDAIDAFSKAISLRSNYAEAYFQRGNATYENTEDYETANKDYEKALSINPEMENTKSAVYAEMFFQASMEVDWENQDERILMLGRAISHNPDRKDLYLERGIAFYYTNDYEKALSDLNRAIEIDDRYEDAFWQRISIYESQGKYDQALADYAKMISFDPTDAGLYYSRGNIYYYNLKNYSKAIEDFSIVIELDPSHQWAHSNRGWCYWRQNKYDWAISDATKAIEIDAEFADAYSLLGACYNSMGQYSKALSEDQKAVGYDQFSAYIYNNRGVSYHGLGQNQNALADYSKAIELDPSKALYYENRAIIYDRLGQTDKANADRRVAKGLE